MNKHTFCSLNVAYSLRQKIRPTFHVYPGPTSPLTSHHPTRSYSCCLLHITNHKPTETMATKQATVASFIESAPPGEVGRNGLPNE